MDYVPGYVRDQRQRDESNYRLPHIRLPKKKPSPTPDFVVFYDPRENIILEVFCSIPMLILATKSIWPRTENGKLNGYVHS